MTYDPNTATPEEVEAHRQEKIARIKASPKYRAKVIQGVKTRYSRGLNNKLAQEGARQSGRWLGLVPRSTALMNHCKARNYGRNKTNENMRREMQRAPLHTFEREDYA